MVHIIWTIWMHCQSQKDSIYDIFIIYSVKEMLNSGLFLLSGIHWLKPIGQRPANRTGSGLDLGLWMPASSVHQLFYSVKKLNYS